VLYMCIFLLYSILYVCVYFLFFSFSGFSFVAFFFITLILLVLTCKNRLPDNLYYVGGDVKPRVVNETYDAETRPRCSETESTTLVKPCTIHDEVSHVISMICGDCR